LLVGTTIVALVLAASGAASRSALWHDCVRANERHGFVRAADGTRIAFAEAGHGTGGIVFAHGARGDLCDFMWALRDPRLSGFRTLAFDYRGNGLSDYPPYPRSVRYRQDAIAAVTQLRKDGAQKVAVLGLSRGGPAAIAAAAQLYPKRAQAAIAVASIDSLIDDNAADAVHHSRVPLLVLAPGQGHADVFRFPRVWNAFVAFLRREVG